MIEPVAEGGTEPTGPGPAPVTGPDGAESPVARPAPTADRRPGLRRVHQLVVPVLLVLAAVVLVSVHVDAYTEVGPIDEMQHIGYLYEVPDVVVAGDRVGQQALEQVACRGLDAKFALPRCGVEPYPAPLFPEAGFNTAYLHPPTYYAITRVIAGGVAALNGITDLVTAGRLAGAVWLAAGLVLSYAAGRRLGATPLQLLGPLLLVAASPAVLMPSATVNPDAASLAVGGGCLLLVVLWTRRSGRMRWGLLVVAGVVAEVVKVQNLVVLLALALFLLLPVISEDRTTRRPLLFSRALAVVTLAVPAVVVAAGWTVAVRLLAATPPADVPMSRRFAVDSLTASDLVLDAGRFLTPLANPYTPPPLEGATTSAALLLTSVLLAAGLVASSVFDDHRGPTRFLGTAVAVVGLLGPPFLVVLIFVTQGLYFAIPDRYGLTLVPMMVVLLALRLTRRWSALAVAGLGVAAVVAACVELAVV